MRLVKPGPATHDEIACIRIDRLLLLDPAVRIFDEFNVQCAREAAGDLALRFREVRTIGIELVGPEMRAAFGVDQLRVHANLIAGPPYAALKGIADAEPG